MKRKMIDSKKTLHPDDAGDTPLLYEKVKWTENGVTQLGTVTEIFSVKGVKYLTVMTIFGRRTTVKMSKVRLYSDYLSV